VWEPKDGSSSIVALHRSPGAVSGETGEAATSLFQPSRRSTQFVNQLSHLARFSDRRSLLLNRAGRRRENSVRVRPDQTNRTNHYYQDHSQHHGVFRDVLPLIVCPESKNEICHGNRSKLIIFSGAGALMLGASLTHMMGANRTTEFNPGWIGMIVLLVSELVKLRNVIGEPDR
jgi:hypothetical protein